MRAGVVLAVALCVAVCAASDDSDTAVDLRMKTTYSPSSRARQSREEAERVRSLEATLSSLRSSKTAGARVLVVGAGPIGLTSAILLRMMGVHEVTVVEARGSFTREQVVRLDNEVLSRLGTFVTARFTRESLFRTEEAERSQNDDPADSVPFTIRDALFTGPSPPGTLVSSKPYLMDQSVWPPVLVTGDDSDSVINADRVYGHIRLNVFQDVLRSFFEALPTNGNESGTVLMNTRLTSLVQQTDGEVVAVVEDARGPRELKFDVMIGADGAASTARVELARVMGIKGGPVLPKDNQDLTRACPVSSDDGLAILEDTPVVFGGIGLVVEDKNSQHVSGTESKDSMYSHCERDACFESVLHRSPNPLDMTLRAFHNNAFAPMGLDSPVHYFGLGIHAGYLAGVAAADCNAECENKAKSCGDDCGGLRGQCEEDCASALSQCHEECQQAKSDPTGYFVSEPGRLRSEATKRAMGDIVEKVADQTQTRGTVVRDGKFFPGLFPICITHASKTVHRDPNTGQTFLLEGDAARTPNFLMASGVNSAIVALMPLRTEEEGEIPLLSVVDAVATERAARGGDAEGDDDEEGPAKESPVEDLIETRQLFGFSITRGLIHKAIQCAQELARPVGTSGGGSSCWNAVEGDLIRQRMYDVTYTRFKGLRKAQQYLRSISGALELAREGSTAGERARGVFRAVAVCSRSGFNEARLSAPFLYRHYGMTDGDDFQELLTQGQELCAAGSHDVLDDSVLEEYMELRLQRWTARMRAAAVKWIASPKINTAQCRKKTEKFFPSSGSYCNLGPVRIDSRRVLCKNLFRAELEKQVLALRKHFGGQPDVCSGAIYDELRMQAAHEGVVAVADPERTK